MQANDTGFSNVIGAFQYKIPYFQRSYVWKTEQLNKFAEDMLYVSDEFIRLNQVQQRFEYFMGTIISKSIPSNTGYQILDLVDGQQRITTFSVFFKVMSLVYSNPMIFDNSFKFSYGFPNSTTVLKLVSSAVDQPILDNIFSLTENVALNSSGNPIPTNKKWSKRAMHPLLVAYNFFRDYLEDLKKNNKYIVPDNIINGVKFINMTLSGNDDPQIYFDNINSLGVRLTTSAIIKNFIFTDNALGYNDYKSCWEPIFEGEHNKYWNGDGGKANIDEFLFCFLQAKTYDKSSNLSATDRVKFSRRDGVANHIKELCKLSMSDNKKILLNEIIRYADTFSKISIDEIGNVTTLHVNNTIDDMLARLGYLIKKLKVSTLVPYLLFLVNKNPAESPETLAMLKYLESYLIRRNLTEMSSDNFNKFFREILIANDILTLDSLKKELSMNNDRSTDMPTDEYILDNLGDLDYEGDNETPKALLYMYELELNKQNGAQTKLMSPDSYTLEHLMPQTLTDEYWPGPNQTADHIYQLGNMGILSQSMQSSIKNLSWQVKLDGNNGKPGIKQGCVGLYSMKYVTSQQVWNNQTIDIRTKEIVKAIISWWKA